MKTDIITLLEIAGVDKTQGKAKTLVENAHNQMLKHYESYLNEIPVEDLVDDIFEYGLDGGDSEEDLAMQDMSTLKDTLLDHMGSSPKDLTAWIQANPIEGK